jgi:plasmid stability protein
VSERRKTRDFLLRDLPQELADKLKVAASLHHVSAKGYIQGILEGHVRDLEKKGITLALPKGKG